VRQPQLNAVENARALSVRAGPTLLLIVLAAWLGACDDPPPKASGAPAKATNEPPKVTEPAAPAGPPHLAIDTLGPKVGFTRVLLDKPEGRSQLAQETAAVKSHFDGKEVGMIVDRKAKISWVSAFFEELSKIGVTRIKVKTETRKEYPTELAFTPVARLSTPAPCSLAGMIMEDRSTAIWKLSGGVASKRAKGFAGPDLTMTGDTIERMAKACKESTLFFVSADEVIEWGLAYDLAASAKTVQLAGLDTFVLLPKIPVPGHKVELGS
jgi:hypothetical protein